MPLKNLLRSRAKRWFDLIQNTKQPLHFLHIGKTGGLHLASHFQYIDERGTKNLLSPLRRLLLRKRFIRVRHDAVRRVFSSNVKNMTFIIREPIERLESAFYYLKNNIGHKAGLSTIEIDLIANFDEFDDFVSSVSNVTCSKHELAKSAFTQAGYHHFYWGYEHYFSSPDKVKATSNIVLVGRFEDYDDYLHKIGSLVGFKFDTTKKTNATIGKDSSLSEKNRKFLKTFLKEEYAIYNELRKKT